MVLERPACAERLRRLVDLVSGDPAAPTTIRDPRRVMEDHVLDSLIALEVPQVQSARTIADLGSGAGFPGLPLAIAKPEAEVWLVEGSTRKCRFLERALSLCEIPNARVVHSRAEEWAAGIGRQDLVTARALARVDVVAEYAAPLLRDGGVAVLWEGAASEEAQRASAAAAEALGLEDLGRKVVRPYAEAAHRHLHVFAKVRSTPSRFPRRAGMARKRPLGGPGTPSSSDRSPR